MNWGFILAIYCGFLALFGWLIHHHNAAFHSGIAGGHPSTAHFLLGGLQRHERASQIVSILAFTFLYWLLIQVLQMIASVMHLFGDLLRLIF